MQRVVVARVALVACVGCAGPSRIEPNVCGNGALEPGEDCDSFTDPALGEGTACVACRYVCDTPEHACPTSWGCSPDEICRFPSGSWVSAGLIDEAAVSVQVGEVNDDDQADLAGAGPNGAWVRFGGPDLRFADRLDLPGNLAFGLPAFHDLTGDELMDAALPVLGAFFVVAGSARGFDVLAQATIEPDPPFVDGLRVLPIVTDTSEPFHDVLAMFANGDLSALALVSNALVPEAFYGFPTYRTPDEIRGIAIGDVDPGPESGADLAITFAGDPRVLIFHTGRRGGVRYLEAGVEVMIPEAVDDELGIAFADLDRDGALDLLVPDAGGVAVAWGDGLGGFSAVSPEPRFDGLGWPLAIGDLDADGVLDYVLADAIYLDRGGALIQRGVGVLSTIAYAAIADFNGDDVNDVALAMREIPRVQIVLGSDLGYFAIVASYLRDTTATAVRAGDFDGDRLDDALFVEPSPFGDTVSVVFGKTDLFYDQPAPMGRYEAIASIETAQIAVPGFAFDVTTDLLVMSSPTGAIGELLGIYVVFGTATRQMASGFNLGFDTRTLFAGAFSPEGDAHPDVVAFTAPVTGNVNPEVNGSTLQIIHGRGDGRFHDSDREFIHSTAVEDGSFDPRPECALWASGDVDGDGRTDVVGLDRCHDPVLLVASLRGTDEEPLLEEALVPLGDRTGPTSFVLGDVDGDGAPDVVITWAEGVAVYWNEAGAFSAARAALLPAFAPGAVWRAAALLNADGDAAPELAVVSATGVLIAEIADRSLALGPGNVAGGGEGIWVGDVDGNQLDDLIVARGERVEVLVAVPHDE